MYISPIPAFNQIDSKHDDAKALLVSSFFFEPLQPLSLVIYILHILNADPQRLILHPNLTSIPLPLLTM